MIEMLLPLDLQYLMRIFSNRHDRLTQKEPVVMQSLSGIK